MEQSVIIDRLAAGEGLSETAPERIDTHISVVLLTRKRAYKLKRAQRTSYLDFRDIAARRAACEKEIALNRRTAPAIYRRAVPVVVDAEGGLSLGGEGEPVEWLVEMNRFDPEATLDRLAPAGEIDSAQFAAIADAVAEMHRTAEVVTDPAAPGFMDDVVEENRVELSERIGAPFSGGDVAALIDRHTGLNRQLAGIYQTRFGAGRFRRCHGDLHLGNICLIDGSPTIFDAIEFNDRFACIDTLYDVAFLLMDLVHRGLNAEANAVFNRYLYRARDFGGFEALPLYLSLRAAIRAHVVAKMLEGVGPGNDAQRLSNDAAAYLDLATEMLDAPAPEMIAVGGYSGTGKSTLAGRIAPSLGAPPGAVVLASDLLRKQRFGLEPAETLPQSAYETDVSRVVYDDMRALAATVVAGGRTVILDATFLHPDSRSAAERAARDAGVRFRGFMLTGDPAVLAQRVADRPKGASDATIGILESQLADGIGKTDWTMVDTTRPGGDSAVAVLDLICSTD